MPILMQMYWEGVKPEQYDKLRNASEYDSDTPQGAIFHTAAYDKKGMRIVDIWENESDFQNFVDKRLMPEVKRLGIKDQPQVEIMKVHASFVPGYSKIMKRMKQSM